ncbi:hypothetical protein [Hamadaea tsunoensis]|uniref:hypothetical protein n=1 Tax=Hamadaea tsunoensis TaxID=53368 RepID=UPI00041700CD|nr:hypothetical protein [Hamadaea tsunoensis]
MISVLIAGLLVGPTPAAYASLAPVDLARWGAFTDTFAAVTATAPLYGLNVGLDTRQTGTAKNISYTRVSGLWNTANPPTSDYAQVNAPGHANRLSLTHGTNAVMLGAPAVADDTGQYTITTTIDPVRGDTASADWASLILSRSRNAWGYPTNADADFGLTVASNGALAVYHGSGTPVWTGSVAATTEYAVSVTVSPTTATVVVNGQSFPVGGSWPGEAYVYLGTYLSSGSELTTFGSGLTGQGLSVSRVDLSVHDNPEIFADDFDGVADTDANSYGLNVDLRTRQPAVVASRYQRVSGNWYSPTPPQPWYSQVNHPVHPGALSFHLGPSGVRVAKPVAADLDGKYAISVKTDPQDSGTTSTDWTSIMLSSSATSNGYVTGSEIDFGLLVRSNGGIQLYRHGTAQWGTEPVVAPAADGSFRVGLTAQGRDLVITVNGTSFAVTLTADIPVNPYLYLGAYISSSSTVSTFDSLRVSRLGGVNYYGYFDVLDPTDHVDHSPAVSAYSNQHVYLDGPGTGFLDYCRPQSCSVMTQWQVFAPDNAGVWHLRTPSDVTNQLGLLSGDVGSNLDKVGTVYVIDEPYNKGLARTDLQQGVTAVRAAFPGKPLSLTLFGRDASTGLPSQLPVSGVERVGFDFYCATQTDLTATLNWLKTNLPSASQQVILFPEASPLWCPGATDASTAARQQVYLNVAATDVRVSTLWNFGWWLGGAGETDPFVHLPQSAAAQTATGKSVIGA